MNNLIVIEYLGGVITNVHCTGKNYRVVLHDVEKDEYLKDGLWEPHFEYLFPADEISKSGQMARDISILLWQGEIK